MTNDVGKLVLIAPPPMQPVCGGSSNEWAHLEAQCGITFPLDFKELIGAYGAGHFAHFFGVANPFYFASQGRNFDRWVNSRLQDIEEAKKVYPDEAIRFETFPKEGGLFPWGYTDNGDSLCWLIQGEEQWPIVCVDDRCSNEFDIYQLSISQFITAWFQKEIPVPKITPANFYPIQEPVFTPYVKV
jgi:hypothetical protein